MKLEKVIRSALYEEEQGSLSIFYSTDIFIRRTEQQKQAQQEKEKEAEAEAEAEAEEEEEEEREEEAEESTDYSFRNSLLNEETFRTNTEGVISVPDEDAKTILTLSDLLAYINRQVDESGKQIINDLVVEIINAYTNPNMQEELDNLVFKGDKINATIDYGFSKEDSVGLQLNKNMGVEDISLVPRQNGTPSSAQFSPDVFKQKIANIFLPEIG